VTIHYVDPLLGITYMMDESLFYTLFSLDISITCCLMYIFSTLFASEERRAMKKMAVVLGVLSVVFAVFAWLIGPYIAHVAFFVGFVLGFIMAVYMPIRSSANTQARSRITGSPTL